MYTGLTPNCLHSFQIVEVTLGQFSFTLIFREAKRTRSLEETQQVLELYSLGLIILNMFPGNIFIFAIWNNVDGP